MREVQREQDPDLRRKFQLGYILFTATERQEIVPLNSPIDEMLQIDWKSGYSVSFTPDSVTLGLPTMTIRMPDSGGVVHLQGTSVTVRRRFEPWARPGIYNNGKMRVAFKVVSTNADSIMIAMGIESPPEPKPPLSELLKQ
jgi:hypothetical protein